MTCDPDQKKFVVAKQVGGGASKEDIEEITYAVSKTFGDGMFVSCKDVQNPSSGKKALDMMCGRPAEQCTIETWLDFMGDPKKNPMTPFKINFDVTANSSIVVENQNHTDVTLYPMKDETMPCNKTCGCQDCQASCVPLPPASVPHTWTILGYDTMYVIMFSIFVGFLLAFGTSQIFIVLFCPTRLNVVTTHGYHQFKVNGNNTSDDVPLLRTPGCYELLQAKFDTLLSRVFAMWGEFCARHPIIIIIAAIVVLAVLIAGISFFTVVTDPVKLWSAPDSRARLEKNYFDENFGYVTSQ